MKPSPYKSMKTAGGKKRSREEAAGSAGGSTPPVSPPRPNPNKEWKKSKAKTKDLLALLNSRFLLEKEVDMCVPPQEIHTQYIRIRMRS
jgi:hypothetical protein